MLDKSLPYTPLLMTKTDTEAYPSYALPEGYRFVFYTVGDEKKWAELECSLGQFDSVEAGLKCFSKEFLEGYAIRPEDRMLFVVDSQGECVATAALWTGDFLGTEHQRVHWVAVSDKCAGKGIAKALLSRVMKLYNDLGYKDFLFLRTGTWNYPAIRIYKSFGFIPYYGERSPFENVPDEFFAEKNAKAWALVEEKHAAYALKNAEFKPKTKSFCK